MPVCQSRKTPTLHQITLQNNQAVKFMSKVHFFNLTSIEENSEVFSPCVVSCKFFTLEISSSQSRSGNSHKIQETSKNEISASYVIIPAVSHFFLLFDYPLFFYPFPNFLLPPGSGASSLIKRKPEPLAFLSLPPFQRSNPQLAFLCVWTYKSFRLFFLFKTCSNALPITVMHACFPIFSLVPRTSFAEGAMPKLTNDTFSIIAGCKCRTLVYDTKSISPETVFFSCPFSQQSVVVAIINDFNCS